MPTASGWRSSACSRRRSSSPTRSCRCRRGPVRPVRRPPRRRLRAAARRGSLGRRADVARPVVRDRHARRCRHRARRAPSSPAATTSGRRSARPRAGPVRSLQRRDRSGSRSRSCRCGGPGRRRSRRRSSSRWQGVLLVAQAPASRRGPAPRACCRGSPTGGCCPSRRCTPRRSACRSILGNWVVTLLHRAGGDSEHVAGIAGGLTLFAGVVSRPLGGRLAGHAGLLRLSFLVGGAGVAVLAVAKPLRSGDRGRRGRGLCRRAAVRALLRGRGAHAPRGAGCGDRHGQHVRRGRPSSSARRWSGSRSRCPATAGSASS